MEVISLLMGEELIPLTDARKEVPGEPAKSTLWRWQKEGVGGVRLETLCYGGRRFTSLGALRRFAERTTAAADGETTAPSTDPSEPGSERLDA
jgi:hypothetical protein